MATTSEETETTVPFGVRLTARQKSRMADAAAAAHYGSTAEWLRVLALTEADRLLGPES